MIEDETPFIQIVFEQVEEFGNAEQTQRLFNLMEAALHGQSGKARKEIDELWWEIQEHKEQLKIPPEEEELLLHHPNMCV